MKHINLDDGWVVYKVRESIRSLVQDYDDWEIGKTYSILFPYIWQDGEGVYEKIYEMPLKPDFVYNAVFDDGLEKFVNNFASQIIADLRKGFQKWPHEYDQENKK